MTLLSGAGIPSEPVGVVAVGGGIAGLSVALGVGRIVGRHAAQRARQISKGA